MIVVLSGEGKTDLGESASGSHIASSDDILFGPLAEMIERLAEPVIGYSLRDTLAYRLYEEAALSDRAKSLSVRKKESLTLPGKKRAQETGFFYTNARSLAVIAREIATEEGCDVVAILFRDSDGTASAGRGEWEAKRKSMENGFNAEDYLHGVPMLAKPKSEAWLLCALRPNPYQGGESLEDESGNDNSPNNLKDQLDAALGEKAHRELLREMVADGRIDPTRIDMPSFNAFNERLNEVFRSVFGRRPA